MYEQYNVVDDHPSIPQEAFLFQPKRSNDLKQRDDFRIGSGDGIRRLLFQGWAQETFTQYQLSKLAELDAYIARKGLQFHEGWNKSWRLRWHLSTGCKVKKTIQDIRKYQLFQNSIRELSFTSNIAKYLNQGIYYMAGRDCHYRPIFVFDVEKIINLDMNEDEIIETQTYFFQYALRNLLIPGQVENWITLIDAAHTGLFSLVGSMKKSFSFLSETYRSRMFVCYVARVPTSISILWGIVKKFLEEQTVKKINFFDQQIIQPLLQFCNPSQLEVKFGGTLPNLVEGQFWPPKQVSTDYKCSKQPVKMMTKQQYTEMYQKKILYDTKFQQDLIYIPKTNADLRQNENATRVKHLERSFKRLMDTAQQQKLTMMSVPLMKTLSYKDLVEKSKENERLQETIIKK